MQQCGCECLRSDELPHSYQHAEEKFNLCCSTNMRIEAFALLASYALHFCKRQGDDQYRKASPCGKERDERRDQRCHHGDQKAQKVLQKTKRSSKTDGCRPFACKNICEPVTHIIDDNYIRGKQADTRGIQEALSPVHVPPLTMREVWQHESCSVAKLYIDEDKPGE